MYGRVGASARREGLAVEELIISIEELLMQ